MITNLVLKTLFFLTVLTPEEKLLTKMITLIKSIENREICTIKM